MKAKSLVIGICIVLALLTTITSALAINQDFLFEDEIGIASYGDRLYPLVDAYVRINLENENNFALDDVTVSLWIPDLWIYTRSSSFTIYRGDTYTRTMFIELPYYVMPGTYLTRILISNEYDHSIKWQYLDIY